MADIIPNIHPTRSELLDIQRRIKLSKRGHKLLEEKKDALIMEFFEKIKKLKNLKAELIRDMETGYRDLIKAESLVGSATVDSVSRSMPQSLELKIETGNVMGVKIPKFTISQHSEDIGLYSSLTSPMVDQSIQDWKKITEKLFILIEAEETLKRLAKEIKSTKRRVNSLEYLTIPRLQATRKYIRSRLEEQERENFFRLKIMKKKGITTIT